MTDQTGTDSAETTTSYGVIAEQAALADQRAAGNTPETLSPQVGGETILALEALRLAHSTNETPAEVVKRAKAYSRYLKEQTNG